LSQGILTPRRAVKEQLMRNPRVEFVELKNSNENKYKL